MCVSCGDKPSQKLTTEFCYEIKDCPECGRVFVECVPKEQLKKMDYIQYNRRIFWGSTN